MHWFHHFYFPTRRLLISLSVLFPNGFIQGAKPLLFFIIFSSLILGGLSFCEGGTIQVSHIADSGEDEYPEIDAQPLIKADLSVIIKYDGRVSPKPDSQQTLPSTCPWGAQVPQNLNLGMAQCAHIPGGTVDEQAVFQRMNQFRSGSTIKWNDCLGDLARSHAQYYVQVKQYTGHGTLSNPNAWLVDQRANAAGLNLSPLDENCLHGDFQYWLQGSAANAVDMWMQDTHSQPILQCKEVGIGVAYMQVTSPPYTEAFIVADFLCN